MALGHYSTQEGAGRVGEETGTPHPTKSSGSWERQETDRWACSEGFLSGRQRARAADEPTDPLRSWKGCIDASGGSGWL